MSQHEASKYNLNWGSLGKSTIVTCSGGPEHAQFKVIAHVQKYGRQECFWEKKYVSPTKARFMCLLSCVRSRKRKGKSMKVKGCLGTQGLGREGEGGDWDTKSCGRSKYTVYIVYIHGNITGNLQLCKINIC